MDKQMIGVFRKRALERSRGEEQKQKELEEHAVTDPLTGLLNRRGFLTYVEDAVARSKRRESASPVSIILIDIDHFKMVNDVYGHNGGDKVLKAVARLLKENVRGADKVGRWGGEEIIVLLEGADEEDAYKRAEGFRKMISSLQIKKNGRIISVTASLGVASRTQDDGFDSNTLIKRSDKALYEAKDAGRDRVVLWTESPDKSQPGHQFELDLGESSV